MCSADTSINSIRHGKFSFEEARSPDTSEGLVRHGKFNFEELPAELRERVYFWATGDHRRVNISSTPGHPECLIIPRIAQLNKRTRAEALHYLYKHRPVEISLHSPFNIQKAYAWVDTLDDQPKHFPRLYFTGRMTAAQNDFFHLTLESAEEPPYFTLSVNHTRIQEGKSIIECMQRNLVELLKYSVDGSKEGQKDALFPSDLRRMIDAIAYIAGVPNVDVLFQQRNEPRKH